MKFFINFFFHFNKKKKGGSPKKKQLSRKSRDDFEGTDFHGNQKCLITSTDQTKLNLYENHGNNINENNFITISQKDERTLQNINSKEINN